MSNFVRRVNHHVVIPIRRGHPKEAFTSLSRGLWSSDYAFGLKRDLTVDFESAPAKIPITVRPITEQDIAVCKAADIVDEEKTEFDARLDFMQRGIRTGYVAVNMDDEPTYMQWLFGPDQNDFIQQRFQGAFPHLNADEALLEYAFTLPSFRGLKIMPRAMDLIARHGADIGARYVITFVNQLNIPALKGCQRAGFNPYLVMRDSWRAYQRHVTFLDLAEGPSYPL